MSLMDLFSNYEKGNRGNRPLIAAVTTTSRVITDGNRGNRENTIIKVSFNKAELSADDRSSILSWLHYINEDDPEIIQEVLDKCANEPEALVYYLKRAEEVPVIHSQCKDCQHFKCFNQHGRGAGTCKAGVTPKGVTHWHSTEHLCNQFINL
jgi:hypothetical protein